MEEALDAGGRIPFALDRLSATARFAIIRQDEKSNIYLLAATASPGPLTEEGDRSSYFCRTIPLDGSARNGRVRHCDRSA